jgi:hypothetical protein
MRSRVLATGVSLGSDGTAPARERRAEQKSHKLARTAEGRGWMEEKGRHGGSVGRQMEQR